MPLNTSVSYMPQPSTCSCPPSNPPNASNPPAGLQGNNSYSYMPLPSVFQRVQDCRLPALKTPQTLPTLPQASKATTLTAIHASAICFSRGSRLPFARRQTPQTLPNASAGLQGNNSYSYMPLPSVFQEVQDCRLPALKPPKRFQPSRRPPRQQLLQLHAAAICFSGGSRLPFARPHQTPQTLPTLPQASKATTLTATCPCHPFFRGFKTAVCPPSNPLKPPKRFRRPPRQQLLQLHAPEHLAGLVCPASNPPKRQQLLQLHAPAICFSGGSRLPFARPQTPQTLPTLPQASKATTLTATCRCHLFFRRFKTAVCPPSSNPRNVSNPPAGLQGNNSYSYMPLPSVFQGVQDCRLPALKPPKRFRRPPRQQLLQLHAPEHLCQLHAPATYMLLPFARPQTLHTLRRPPRQQLLQLHAPEHLCQLHAPAIYMLLPALKPPKRFQPSRRPPREQLLQLHAAAICFSGGSRVPFARPQTPQTLPQASKATTLTAIHAPAICFSGGSRLPFARRQTPQTLPNASAGLQGNNSYSYMPLPSVFQEVQDCRLAALKPPKRFQPSRRPPRQQLLQLHAPAICFSGGSRLPFACPHQTPQTLPTLPQASKQASKATTLTATATATCPCHLFFRGCMGYKSL